MSAPAWEPVDDTTHDLLSLVAEDEHPSVDFEWTAWLAAVHDVVDINGRVDPNHLRREVRGVIAPKRLGAFTHRALTSGLFVWRGDWLMSTDAEGRNAGRPVRCYYLTREPA